VWNATQISLSALTTSVITRREASPTSRDVAQAVAHLAVPSAKAVVAVAVAVVAAAVAEEDSPTTPPARCTQRFAPSAARTPKCPSGLAATDPCTAMTASADAGPAAAPSRPQRL